MFTQKRLAMLLAVAMMALGASASFADGNLREDSNQLENRAGELAHRIKKEAPGNYELNSWAQALAGQATRFHQMAKGGYQYWQLTNEYYQLERYYSGVESIMSRSYLPGNVTSKFQDMSRAFYKVYSYFH